MNFKTYRLLLKQVSLKDTKEISIVGNDKEISYFTYYWPYPLTIKKTEKILNKIEKEWKEKKTVIMFKIQLKETREIIGLLDIYDIERIDKKGKIGYWLGRNYWGRGYVLESLNGAINFAFNKLNLQKLFADILIDNLSSNKLLKKAGFRRIGIMKKDKLVNGKFLDRYLWELTDKV